MYVGKVIVVSGGSRGIGRGIAAAFAAEGAQTVLAAASQANLDAAAQAISRNATLKPDVCAGDLRHEDGCERVFRFVSQRHGRCDILVNSAGATRAGAFLNLDQEAWQDGFALKFFAHVRLARAAWPSLKERRGSLVTIAGTGGRRSAGRRP